MNQKNKHRKKPEFNLVLAIWYAIGVALITAGGILLVKDFIGTALGWW